MGQIEYAARFRDLIGYRKARKVSLESVLIFAYCWLRLPNPSQKARKLLPDLPDLAIWQSRKDFQNALLEIFRLTKRFPREEAYALTDQSRHSSRSTGAQIAEAWAMRRYEKYFVSKLTDSDGEQQETQHWVETAFDCEYISQEEAKALLEKCMEIGRLLGGMIAKAEQFCNPSPYQAHQDCGEYFVNSSQHTEH